MNYIARMPAFLAAATLLGLVVMTIAGVVMRYFFQAPLHWGEEMSGLLMVWIVFLGMSAAERDGSSLTISFLTDGMSAKVSAAVNLIMAVLSIILLAYMAWLGWKLANSVQFRLTQILKVSWYWIYIAVPIGALMTILVFVSQLGGFARILAGKQSEQS